MSKPQCYDCPDYNFKSRKVGGALPDVTRSFPTTDYPLSKQIEHQLNERLTIKCLSPQTSLITGAEVGWEGQSKLVYSEKMHEN